MHNIITQHLPLQNIYCYKGIVHDYYLFIFFSFLCRSFVGILEARVGINTASGGDVNDFVSVLVRSVTERGRALLVYVGPDLGRLVYMGRFDTPDLGLVVF